MHDYLSPITLVSSPRFSIAFKNAQSIHHSMITHLKTGFLWLAGLGLDPPRTMPHGVLNALVQADECWLEAYTSLHPQIRDVMASLSTSLPCTLASRRMVEEQLLERLRAGRKILLLVLGDPLSATTHTSLLADATRAGIPFTILPASSVFTSIAKTGISIYKLGRTITIPYPRRSWRPTSWQDQLSSTIQQGLHSLILLDIITDPEERSQIDPAFTPWQQDTAWLMTLRDAIRLLQDVLPPEAFLISCTRLDQEGEVLLHGMLADYAAMADSLPVEGPHCLIHAQPDSMERELIQTLTKSLSVWRQENTL